MVSTEAYRTISALITVLDPATGMPVALLDGAAVTTRRTAAGSAVAADLLARHDASRLGVVGSGVQAIAHVRALTRVRDLTEIRVWSPNAANRQAASAQLREELGLGVRAVGTAEEAVRHTDIVAACTNSREPVVRGEWLRPGCTVITVGSFQPDRCELDWDTLTRSHPVVVDDMATCAEHSGAVVAGLASGDVEETELVGLGDVASGGVAGRTSDSDVVAYVSVGLGIQDAAAAEAIVDRAREAGKGRVIQL